MTAPGPLLRPSEWRQPGKGDHACNGCHGLAVYGEGSTWWCRSCVPKGFLPKDREAARA